MLGDTNLENELDTEIEEPFYKKQAVMEASSSGPKAYLNQTCLNCNWLDFDAEGCTLHLTAQADWRTPACSSFEEYSISN